MDFIESVDADAERLRRDLDLHDANGPNGLLRIPDKVDEFVALLLLPSVRYPLSVSKNCFLHVRWVDVRYLFVCGDYTEVTHTNEEMEGKANKKKFC